MLKCVVWQSVAQRGPPVDALHGRSFDLFACFSLETPAPRCGWASHERIELCGEEVLCKEEKNGTGDGAEKEQPSFLAALSKGKSCAALAIREKMVLLPTDLPVVRSPPISVTCNLCRCN